MSALIKLTDRIYRLPGQTETDQPNLYYVRGDRESAAIDAGQSRRHVEEFYGALREEGLPLPSYTLITHWHWDHTFGLKYISGVSMASRLTKEKLAQVSRWAWTPESMRKREETGEDIAFCNECIRKEYPDLGKISVFRFVYLAVGHYLDKAVFQFFNLVEGCQHRKRGIGKTFHSDLWYISLTNRALHGTVFVAQIRSLVLFSHRKDFIRSWIASSIFDLLQAVC